MRNATMALGFSHLGCGVGISLTAVVALSGCLAGCATNLPECLKDQPFTVSPLAPADFTSITPLGNLNPPSHTLPTDHVYLELRREKDSTPSIPVVSPGHLWITRIARTEYTNAPDHSNDYKVIFQPCKSVRGWFDHVQTLSPRILGKLGTIDKNACQQFPVGAGNASQCAKKVMIELQPGEVIGTAGAGQNALDFGLQDARVAPLPFANPAHHRKSPDGLDDFHGVCPIEYFDPATRAALDAKLDHEGDGPRCGTVAQDAPGTAQGDWFLEGSPNFPEEPHLALVHDNVDGDKGVISLGNGLHTGGAAFQIETTSEGFVNREFKDVTADDNVYCYEGKREADSDRRKVLILIQLVAPDRLRVQERTAPQCGRAPFEFKGLTFDFVR